MVTYSRGVVVGCLCVAGISLGVAGCGPSYYRPFDSESHLRERIAESIQRSPVDPGVSPEEIELPFALNEDLRLLAESEVSLAGGDRWRVDQIIDLIFEDLDLEYSLYPTRSAVETFEAREGNCLSFVNLFVGIGRERKLNPFYVEVKDYSRWDYKQGSVISHGHIVAGLYVDGKLQTYDFLPYRAKSYRDFQPIDDLRATAHYYNNLGADALLNGEVERAHSLFRVAAAIAPEFPKAVNNLGVSQLRLGRAEEALATYRRGLEASPNDVALLTNLARFHQQRGEEEKTRELFARLEATNAASPFYFVYRGEMELADGNTDEALRYLAKALRVDTEIPEIHVGLAKVYISLGDLRKARHHLERALDLDGSHREALRYARMIRISSAPPRSLGDGSSQTSRDSPLERP